MRGRAHQEKPPFDTKKHVLDFYNQICFPPYETKMTEEDGEVTMFFTSPERPNPADLIEMDFPPRKEADPKTPKSVVKVLSSQRSKDILDSAPPTCAETKRFLEWSELPRIHPMMIRYRILALMQADLESGLPELLGAVSTPHVYYNFRDDHKRVLRNVKDAVYDSKFTVSSKTTLEEFSAHLTPLAEKYHLDMASRMIKLVFQTYMKMLSSTTRRSSDILRNTNLASSNF